jgi:chromosome segregation ATPase
VAQHQQHAKEIFRVERNLDEIQRSLAYLRRQASARSDGRIDKLSDAYFTLSEQLETFRAEAQDLSQRVKAKVEGKIVAQEVYGGVTLKIGPQHRRITSFVKMLEFEAPAEELEAVVCSDNGSDVCLDSDKEAWLGVGQTP